MGRCAICGAVEGDDEAELRQRDPDRFLRLKQILGDKKAGVPPIIPVSKTTWWDGIRDGRYPPPDRRIGRTTMWKASTVFRLLAVEEAASKRAPAASSPSWRTALPISLCDACCASIEARLRAGKQFRAGG